MSRSDNNADTTLVARCKAGELQAFAQLYRQHVQKTYRACCAMVGDPAEAEDLLQDTFVLAFRKIHTFDNTSQFSTWLYGIALRLAANQRRSRRRRQRLKAAHIEANPQPAK
ncbi:RNA polymerase sigma factor, partial [Myxococcota bacterium]